MDELGELSRDLYRAADEVGDETKKVVGRGSLNIKNDWREAWDDLAHAKRIKYAISYDVTRTPGGDIITGEIGPVVTNDRLQGPLGGILEFGSVNNAPIPGGGPALIKESPRFEDALGDMGERLLRNE